VATLESVRGDIEGFSAAAVSRYQSALCGLLQHCLDTDQVAYMHTFTLGPKRLSCDMYRGVLQPFNKTLRGHGVVGIWTRELQKRGAVHWHVVLLFPASCTLRPDEVTALWLRQKRVAASGALPAGQHYTATYGQSRLVAYLGKELSKSQQKYGPGRKWGVFPKRYWDACGLKVETEIRDPDEVRRVEYLVRASWLQWFMERGKHFYVALCCLGLRSLPSRWLFPAYMGRPFAPPHVPESFEWGRPRLLSGRFLGEDGVRVRPWLRLPLWSCGVCLDLGFRWLSGGVAAVWLDEMFPTEDSASTPVLRLETVRRVLRRRYAAFGLEDLFTEHWALLRA